MNSKMVSMLALRKGFSNDYLISRELNQFIVIKNNSSGVSFEGISQLRTYSGEETSQNLSLFGEKFILAKNIPMESEPDTYR